VTATADTNPEQFRRQTFESKRWVSFAKGGAYFATTPIFTVL
jgi:hypothetical protein